MKNAPDQTMKSSKTSSTIRWIAILIGFTFMRAFMGLQLPNLEMLGGLNPDAWLIPMISDLTLGIIVPVMIYLLLKRRNTKVWGILIAYNAIGAFDYIHGLITEWTDPLIPNGLMGTPELTFGAIAFSLIAQLIALYLLFKPSVINNFTRSEDQ